MSARKHVGSLASPSLAEKKSAMLAQALGDDFSVEVLDEDTVEILARGRSICRISFEDETDTPAHRVRSRN